MPSLGLELLNGDQILASARVFHQLRKAPAPVDIRARGDDCFTLGSRARKADDILEFVVWNIDSSFQYSNP
jgi:hypothetical protein